MGPLEQRALEILKDFPQIEIQPASLSGINHCGETCRQHLDRCASVMRHLCDKNIGKGGEIVGRIKV
jgi:hypothetical protein